MINFPTFTNKLCELLIPPHLFKEIYSVMIERHIWRREKIITYSPLFFCIFPHTVSNSKLLLCFPLQSSISCTNLPHCPLNTSGIFMNMQWIPVPLRTSTFYDVMKVSETAILPWLSPGLSMLHYAIGICSNGLQKMFFSSELREGPKAVEPRLFFLSCDISKREVDRSLLFLPCAIAKISPRMQIPVVHNNLKC